MNQFDTTKAVLWWHRITTKKKQSNGSLSLKKRGKIPEFITLGNSITNEKN